MKEYLFKVNNYQDRQNMITAFANSGYAVCVKEEKKFPTGIDYWVKINGSIRVKEKDIINNKDLDNVIDETESTILDIEKKEGIIPFNKTETIELKKTKVKEKPFLNIMERLELEKNNKKDE